MENEENKKSKNYTDVLLEKINGKFDFLVEESKMVKGKLESLETKVNSLETKVDSLDIKVTALDIKLEAVKGDTESLKEDVDYVKSAIVDDKDKFKKANKRMDDHETRLSGLEKAVLAKA